MAQLPREPLQRVATVQGCCFVPLRGVKKPCGNMLINEYGFCSKHVKTAQAKATKEEFDKRQEQIRRQQLKELEEELDNLSSGDEDKIIITPNTWGRFEEPNTGIVFNPDSTVAIGVQSPDGKVLELDEEAIAKCIENGWSYLIKNKSAKARKLPVQEEPEPEEEVDEEETETEDPADGDGRMSCSRRMKRTRTVTTPRARVSFSQKETCYGTNSGTLATE